MKKILVIMMAMVLCFAMAACGGSDGGDTKKSEQAYVTPEKYQDLSDADWADMTPEEMTEFLGVDYVTDEESTKDWGEDEYLVVDYPGPDKDSYVHALFKKADDGTFKASSISPNGQLMSD